MLHLYLYAACFLLALACWFSATAKPEGCILPLLQRAAMSQKVEIMCMWCLHTREASLEEETHRPSKHTQVRQSSLPQTDLASKEHEPLSQVLLDSLPVLQTLSQTSLLAFMMHRPFSWERTELFQNWSAPLILFLWLQHSASNLLYILVVHCKCTWR